MAIKGLPRLILLLMLKCIGADLIHGTEGLYHLLDGQYSSSTRVVISRTDLVEVDKELISKITNVASLKLENNYKLKYISTDAFEDLVSLSTLNIRNSKLELFPNLYPVRLTLQTLSIENCKITTIPANAFNGVQMLTSISLKRFHLVEFPNVAGIISLNKIKISGMSLATIPPEYLPGSVNQFEITINAASVGPVELMHYMPNVTYLNLNSNNLTIHINKVLDGCQQLKTISLQKNNLTEFPDFGNCSDTLELIYLNDNNITNISEDHGGKLTAVKNLYLQRNKLMSIPTILTNLNRLTYIDLSENSMNSGSYGLALQVPPSTTTLFLVIKEVGLEQFPNISIATKLTTLNVKNNSISYFEASSIGTHLALQNLFISYNKLQQFPPIASLSRLTTLHLQHNNITHLSVLHMNPDNLHITSLTLKQLDLSYNDLDGHMDSSIWGFMGSLTELKLVHCKLKELPSNLKLPASLQDLYLDDNLMKQFPGYILSALPLLKTLSLQGNKLKTIPGTNIKTLSDLQMLDLRYNKLQRVASIQNIMRPRFELKLQGNPLLCNAVMCWMKKTDALGSSKISLDKKPCSSPTYLNDTEWSAITEEDLRCHEYAGTLLDLDGPVDVFLEQPEKIQPSSVYTWAALEDYSTALIREGAATTLPSCSLECAAFKNICMGFAYIVRERQCWLIVG